MRYRPEIDGLRAVALLPVIFFHAGIERFSGGFVGVDVFFVISGYLITSIILDARASGTFSLLDFYERRARRILPALLVIMVACWPFGWFWMFPYQMQDFSESLLAVLMFVSNMFFGKTWGYFDQDAEQNPLLHTWSLAIEEQFYIGFPLLLMFIMGRGRRWVQATMGALAILSLIIAQWHASQPLPPEFFRIGKNIPGQPINYFFLLQTRAWELLLGGILAIALRDKLETRLSGPVRQAGSLVGLVLIGYAVLVFDDSIPFPSLYSLIPTVGAVCIISFATPQTMVGRMLSHRGLVGLGLISYSAYLWHHPLFAFTRIRSLEQVSQGTYLFLTVGAIGLAYITWRFIERPFRDKKRITRKTLVAFVVGMSGLLVGLGLLGSFTNGFEKRYSAEDRDLLVAPEVHAEYVTKRHSALDNLGGFTGSPSRRLVVIGDSFSQDFINMIFEVGAFSEYQIRTVYIEARCQIYYGPEDISKFIHARDQELCRNKDYAPELASLIKEADVIIFVANWKGWAAERLPHTIANLAIPQDKEIFVIGRKKFGKYTMRKFISMSIHERSRQRNPTGGYHLRVNSAMASLFPEAQFVNIHRLLCGKDSRDCPVFTNEGKLISFDGGHLTQAGARFIGEIIFTESILKKFR